MKTDRKKIKVDPVIPVNENPTATEADLEKKEKLLVKKIKLEIKNGIPDPELLQRLLENREQVKKIRAALEKERSER